MKLKFAVDKKQEVEIYLSFLKDAKYQNLDREFNWAFYAAHPKLRIIRDNKLSEKEGIVIVKQYVNDYYRKHLSTIKEKTNLAKKDWAKYEKGFFALTKKIFKNYPWPKGKYIAYPTLWGIAPRNIKDKTYSFTFWNARKNYSRITAAHEMLHFIFYDYVYKNFPKYKNQKYDFKLWDVSEAFNIAFQNSPEWVKYFGGKALPYPEHKDLTKKIIKLWKEKPDLDYLLTNILPK